AMADMTGGEYFKAENANQLIRIFQDLPSRIVLQTEARELSAIFVALGGLFVAIGVILSLLRNRFP
ncbi:MAG: ABC transporter ATP-binding protein, partial [Chloroflexota bacterium]